jgi:hypothetical protein
MNELEQRVAKELGFQVSRPGHRKVEFLGDVEKEGKKVFGVRNTRPATAQECVLWDELVTVHQRLEARVSELEGIWPEDPGPVGVQADSVRDSLGTPPNMPRLGGFPSS